ncbi:MAG: HIT family protein [Candidatus Paceibacterota bacterium]
MEHDCIFCKIIKKEIPCEKIYENENLLAFLDINPISHGHILVVPKKHVIWMQEADDKTISEIFKLSKKLMLAIKNGIMCDYVQVSVGGTDVPHFHIHLIPRYHNDSFVSWPTKKYENKEIDEITNKIIKSIL